MLEYPLHSTGGLVYLGESQRAQDVLKLSESLYFRSIIELFECQLLSLDNININFITMSYLLIMAIALNFNRVYTLKIMQTIQNENKTKAMLI